MAYWSQGTPRWVRDRFSIQTAQCSHEGFLYWEGARKRSEKSSASGFVGRERDTEMQKDKEAERQTQRKRGRETQRDRESGGQSWGEGKREKKRKREKREKADRGSTF